jgi:transposase
MAAVIIGVDPHKGSHTAVVIDQAEMALDEVRVRASAAQVQLLLAWAAAWPERTWAVEGAGGLGHLLAQQLVAAGERVLDVQPKLAARVRLLAAGDVNKNDPNDARSVAVVALRSAACPQVRPDDHAAVLKVWAKRHRDLSRSRNQVACRLHAVLCELVPGGVSKRIYAAGAARILDQIEPCSAVQAARCELAGEFLADLRRIDAQRRDTRQKLAVAVRASGTSVTEVFGVGPAVAAAVIGDVRDISRFPTRNHFAAYDGTAPAEVSSGNRVIYRLSLRGNRRLNHAIHMAAVTQIRYPHSKGRAYYDKKIAEGKTAKEALRALKRQVSDAIYQHLKADARRAAAATAGPGGHPGNDSVASVAGSHPEHRLFGQATPGPAPTLRSRPAPAKATPRTGKPRRASQSVHAPIRLAAQQTQPRRSRLLPHPVPRRSSPAPKRHSRCATTLRAQEFDKGRGPVGLPPIGQACDLPAWPDQGPREGSLVKFRSGHQPHADAHRERRHPGQRRPS